MSAFERHKWCVYIVGTDDVIVAENFSSAVKKAEEINAGIIGAADAGHFDSPYSPLAWAKVGLMEDMVSDYVFDDGDSANE